MSIKKEKPPSLAYSFSDYITFLSQTAKLLRNSTTFNELECHFEAKSLLSSIIGEKFVASSTGVLCDFLILPLQRRDFSFFSTRINKIPYSLPSRATQIYRVEEKKTRCCCWINKIFIET